MGLSTATYSASVFFTRLCRQLCTFFQDELPEGQMREMLSRMFRQASATVDKPVTADVDGAFRVLLP
jgi:hypothetical protein